MAKRVHKGALMELAKRMFVEEGMTAKAIANSIDVTPQTVGRWRKGIGKNALSWDEERKQFLATPYNIKKLLSKELTAMVAGNEATLDIKGINDVIKALKSVSENTSVQVVFTVFKEFDNWMSEQEPETAISFLEWHKLFLLHKAQQEQ